MDKNTFYTMAHTNDPTVVSPDANEESFSRPVDVDPKKTNPYNDVYYGYGYVENMKFKPSENSGGGGSSGGGGGATGDGVTQEEMVQAINNALNSISLTRSGDDNTVVLNVGGRQNEVTIDDKYLTGVTNTDDGNVVFTMNNGDSITTALTDLDERNFDCDTF